VGKLHFVSLTLSPRPLLNFATAILNIGEISLFRKKAFPEFDLRYLSKSFASCKFEKAMYVSISHGANFFVWPAPILLLCAMIRFFKSDVLPT